VPREGYLLVLSRLLGYKRVDLAIEAGAQAGVPVVVAGEGPERSRLEELSRGRASFLGRVPDERLPELFGRSRALFLGGEEDFGITPLEANAAGRPVVAFGRGGACETVRDGVTGTLFAEQTTAAARVAVQRTLAREWDPATLAAHARAFGPARFAEGLTQAVDRCLARSRTGGAPRFEIAPDRAGTSGRARERILV
jgi:glycosyltransferase involved in cell wall biosynthesis